ncbi:beta-ketoacyl synthase [Izhakiella australiensis]|uniref:Beta-ketoacyl synthase n=1 Tax=Izhakiella australiensis TaxID=1926881 RepID=A0A1S8YPK1_9GAMM|nr:beta-ketoacyl synthase chain length factor [Izhakiella australiensis]OON40747.1 beta-ketoacyl synthase [Izhakiella australiensis]
MKLAFRLLDWQASAPGLATAGDWAEWARQAATIDATQPLAKSQHLPMMTARRLNSGSRAAVDCAMALLARNQPQAAVFTSRHGELERNLRILTALAQQQPLSPTDFTMSVHNAAAGSLTLAAKAPLITSSLAAGIDSFQQGLVEVATLHCAGYQQVMLVDFDGAIPDCYHPWLPENTPTWPYAVALLLTAGDQWQCRALPAQSEKQEALPQSLQFLHHLLAESEHFTLAGDRLSWQWDRHSE